MATKNWAYSTVATAPAPTTTGTSLVVASGDGSKFYVGKAWIWPTGVQPLTSNAEVISISAISTDTLTIVRGQEGSTARNVVNGDQIAQGLTAAMFDALVDTSSTQTVSGKTLDNTTALTIKDANLTVQNSSDTTKQAKLDLSLLNTGITYTFKLPADSPGTLVTAAATQTLTNKTLTSPVINTGTVGADPTVALGIASKQYVDSKAGVSFLTIQVFS